MQAFDGVALLTYKLHLAIRHLFDQIGCQGPGAGVLELWIERMILYLKSEVRDKVRENPEVIFMNDHLLAEAAAKARAEEPEHCWSCAELGKPGHQQAFPQYDEDFDGVLLLGKRDSAGLTNGEALSVVSRLAKQIKSAPSHYHVRGWPAVSQGVLRRMHATGLLVFDKFRQASLGSQDVMSSELDRSQPVSDNRWAYIDFALPGGGAQHCIALMQYFVRARLSETGEQCFVAQDCEACQVQIPQDTDGQQIEAIPMRFAMTKLWLVDICDAGTVGCRTEMDAVTGELPDLFKLANVSDDASNKVRFGRDGQVVSGKYFGEWLADVAELQTQVVPTRELVRGGKRVRFFMTAHKASGRMPARGMYD